ncbi:MAG: DNA mismatch repair endonuclease MutL, partial [Desulfomonilaceae bacterium]
RSEKDLIGIATMGFRGEALASIASISRMRLMTKDQIAEVGTCLIWEGGTLTNFEPLAMNQGTVIEVRNLFYNTPVRRKYLKNASYESGYIHDLVLKIAIANPTIAFTFTDGGKIKIQTPRMISFKERVCSIFPAEIVENLVELDCQLDGATLSGFIAKPPYTRSSMRYIFTFVNSRPVKDRLVNATIIKVFSNLVERGRYPFAIVHIKTHPEEVDVNVHPQKAEVRFLKPGSISGLITKAINEAVIGKIPRDPRSFNDWSRPSPFVTGVSRYISKDGPRQASGASYNIGKRTNFSLPSRETHNTSETPVNHRKLSELSILGKLPNSFVVLYGNDDLVVLDHHAAHERLIFNSLCNLSAQNQFRESQDLLIPQIVELTVLEGEALKENFEILHAAGFLVEEFGQTSFLIRSIPSWIKGVNLDDLFKGFVDTALETGLKSDPEALRKNLYRNLACKAAIKESSTVTITEIRDLISSLENSDGPSDVCPHGRPILVRISFDEIKRRMGRK